MPPDELDCAEGTLVSTYEKRKGPKMLIKTLNIYIARFSPQETFRKVAK